MEKNIVYVVLCHSEDKYCSCSRIMGTFSNIDNARKDMKLIFDDFVENIWQVSEDNTEKTISDDEMELFDISTCEKKLNISVVEQEVLTF